MTERSSSHRKEQTPKKKQDKISSSENQAISPSNKASICIYSSKDSKDPISLPRKDVKEEKGKARNDSGKEIPLSVKKDRVNRQLDQTPRVVVWDWPEKFKYRDPLDRFEVPPHVRDEPKDSK